MILKLTLEQGFSAGALCNARGCYEPIIKDEEARSQMGDIFFSHIKSNKQQTNKKKIFTISTSVSCFSVRLLRQIKT